MKDPLNVVRGTLNVLVLKALSWGPMHGFEITGWIEERAAGNLEVLDSALYQALYRLEEKGLVDADWGVTDNNRRARYYRLSTQGKGHLRQETVRWLRYADTVAASFALPPRRARDNAPPMTPGRLPPRVRRALHIPLGRATRVEAELDEEIGFHVAMRIEQLTHRSHPRRGGTGGNAPLRVAHRFDPSCSLPLVTAKGG